MYYVLVGLYVLVCFLLLVVVLLQQGKGGDIAAAFGGSSSQTAFGARAGATFLTRATAVLATLFMLGAFGLGVIGRDSGSVLGGVQGPAQLPGGGNLPVPPAASSTPTPTPPAGSSTPTSSPTASPSPTGSPAASAKPAPQGTTAKPPAPATTKTPPPPAGK